jgi:hypothetical protein
MFLVKLTPVVNFTNIVLKAFLLILFGKNYKLQSQTVTTENFQETLSNKKLEANL